MNVSLAYRARDHAGRLLPGGQAWTGPRLVATVCAVLLVVWVAAATGDRAAWSAAAAALGARWDLLGVFAGTYATAFALRSVAWAVLLPAHERGAAGLPRLFAILHVSLLANHVFPTKAGEVIRPALLAGGGGVPLGVAAGSTALARLLDLLALGLIVVVVAPLAGGRLEAYLAPLAALLVVVLGVAVGLAIASGRATSLWSRLPVRVARLAREAQAALRTVRLTQIVLALALVVPSWLLEAGAVWSVAQAVQVPLSLPAAAAATAMTIALQTFQVTPGGIGLYETSMSAALVTFGVEPHTAISAAVLTHAIKFVYAYATGLPCLLFCGAGRLRLRAL